MCSCYVYLYLQESLHFLSKIEIYLCVRILLVKCYQSQRVLVQWMMT